MTDTKEPRTKHYHICQSIAGLERLMERGEDITWLTLDDKPAIFAEIRAAIKDAKAKGYDVLPPCDNVTATGHCAGHENKEEM
jgi:hypothetical protein